MADEALAEVHQAYQVASQNLHTTRAQFTHYKRKKQQSALTLVDLGELPPETNTYKAVGRAFIFAQQAQVTATLEAEMADCDARLQKLAGQEQYLLRQLDEAEQQIREAGGAED